MQAGSVTRIAAPEIEEVVEEAARRKLRLPEDASREVISDQIERATVGSASISIVVKTNDQSDRSSPETIEIPWTPAKANHVYVPPPSERTADPKLLQAVARAHAWLTDLKGGRFSSIKELAAAVRLHPKVIRQSLRLAFLERETTSAILNGDQLQRLTLRRIPNLLPLAWTAQREILY